MSNLPTSPTQSVLVEEDLEFTLVEISRACGADAEHLVALVVEGVLSPQGGAREQWRFRGADLARARTALRLMRDLDLNPPAVALVLELLDEIKALRSQLRSR
jgi:chaperone modulatory protein CbpM